MKPLELAAPLGRTLREQVLSRLRIAIVNGELPPGEPLRQDQLAEWLGVSSTPVREAIADLAREQLVELEPNRGARVRPLTLKGSIDLAETYRLLFEAAYCAGLPRLGENDYSELEERVEQLRHCCSGEDWRAAFDADTAIHEVVFRAADNADLAALLHSLRSRVQRLINLRFPHTIYTEAPPAYDAIFGASRAGDLERAKDLLARTWDGWQAMVTAWVPDEQAAPA